jgi:hypothetical protein
MKNKSFTDLPVKTQEDIRSRYLSYETVSSISDRYDIPRTSLDYHVKQRWYQERELLRSELFANYAAGKQAEFVGLSNSSLSILRKGFEALADREDPPSVREMGQVAKIFETLDKIMKLDAGDPTSITAEKPLSIKEIKQELGIIDPFNKEEIEVVEYTENID